MEASTARNSKSSTRKGAHPRWWIYQASSWNQEARTLTNAAQGAVGGRVLLPCYQMHLWISAYPPLRLSVRSDECRIIAYICSTFTFREWFLLRCVRAHLVYFFWLEQFYWSNVGLYDIRRWHQKKQYNGLCVRLQQLSTVTRGFVYSSRLSHRIDRKFSVLCLRRTKQCTRTNHKVWCFVGFAVLVGECIGVKITTTN